MLEVVNVSESEFAVHGVVYLFISEFRRFAAGHTSRPPVRSARPQRGLRLSGAAESDSKQS